MAVVSFLAAAAIALSFVIPMAAGKYGAMAGSRFIERTLTYSPVTLRDWIAGDAVGVRGYVFPVLFPLDLFFMIALGGFCAFASFYCAELASPGGSYHRLLAIAPLLYVVSDLTEDIAIARLLKHPDRIDERTVRALKAVTITKFIFSSAAIAQALACSVWAFIAPAV